RITQHDAVELALISSDPPPRLVAGELRVGDACVYRADPLDALPANGLVLFRRTTSCQPATGSPAPAPLELTTEAGRRVLVWAYGPSGRPDEPSALTIADPGVPESIVHPMVAGNFVDFDTGPPVRRGALLNYAWQIGRPRGWVPAALAMLGLVVYAALAFG